MQERNERSATAKRLRAAVSVLVIGATVSLPAVAAPNALTRAREKMAYDQAKAAADAKAAAEKAAEEAKAAARQKALAALAFNPFAVKLGDPLPKPATREEATRQLVEKVRRLQRMAVARNNMIMLAQVQASRRSPNTPPPYTAPRPSDPLRPGDNVAPGPE